MKKIVAALLVGAILLGGTGCGSGGASDTASQSSPQPAAESDLSLIHI